MGTSVGPLLWLVVSFSAVSVTVGTVIIRGNRIVTIVTIFWSKGHNLSPFLKEDLANAFLSKVQILPVWFYSTFLINFVNSKLRTVLF
jgi:hypothetical protein